MNHIHPIFTNMRSFIAHKFSALHMQAARNSLWSRIIGRDARLEVFPRPIRRRDPERKWMGMQEILIEKIVGTLGERKDFDREFRPLHAHMLDRWVRTYLQVEREGWPAIQLHKIGESYYVENDQYLLSVAREAGMPLMTAEVWEYPQQVLKAEKGRPVQCAEKEPATYTFAG